MDLNIQPIITKNGRRLIPLAQYKGPKLDLMFYEADEIKLLNKELLRLELEAGQVISTLNINKHLTGYQKDKCKYKLSFIQEAIDTVKNNILKIKKKRFSIQKEEYQNSIK